MRDHDLPGGSGWSTQKKFKVDGSFRLKILFGTINGKDVYEAKCYFDWEMVTSRDSNPLVGRKGSVARNLSEIGIVALSVMSLSIWFG